MAWSGIVESSRQGKGLTVPEFKEYVETLVFVGWRPSFMTLHNTGLPTLATTKSDGTFDTYSWKGATPPPQRILNLERYYRDDQGWPSGPHAFVADDFIWPFTPFTMRGTHSPSWNGSALGIELVGDYEREDPYSGYGLKAYKNAVAVFAILHAKIGMAVSQVKFHREDPRTTHKCPGKNLWQLGNGRDRFIQDVREYMGSGGEHSPDEDPDHPAPTPPRNGTVSNTVGTEGLNVRESPSASAHIVAVAAAGEKMVIYNEAMNGTTKWYRVWYRDDKTSLEHRGWASAKYIVVS